MTRAAALALALATLLLGACGGGDTTARKRVLVVGWDGATWSMVDALLQAGRLPNLQELVERGATYELASTMPPISSAAWVGAVTGKGPGETGVYSFFESVEGTYDVRVISARSNRAPPLWRILGAHGKRSIVFGVPVTWPPEPIQGSLVSGMLTPRDATWAHPPELDRELKSRGFVPDLGIWTAEEALSPERISTQLELKRSLTKGLIEREDWDLALIVFKNLDVLCHKRFDGRLDGEVARLYQDLDRVLGELVRAAGEGTDVIVLSDHGFTTYARAFSTQTWLVAEGLATPRADAPVPRPIGGPLATRRAAESRRRVDALDLGRTTALAGFAEGNYGTIRLNLAGREPNGTVDPADAERVLADVERRLRALRVGKSGRPLVTRVMRTRELYPGSALGTLPELVFETDPEVLVRADPARAVQGVLPRPFPDHLRTGICVTSGPSFQGARARAEASVLDLAPTVLAVLGLPIHAEMQGAVVPGLDVPGLRVVREAEVPGLEPRAPRDAATGAEDELLDRLGDLGYGE